MRKALTGRLRFTNDAVAGLDAGWKRRSRAHVPES